MKQKLLEMVPVAKRVPKLSSRVTLATSWAGVVSHMYKYTYLLPLSHTVPHYYEIFDPNKNTCVSWSKSHLKFQ